MYRILRSQRKTFTNRSEILGQAMAEKNETQIDQQSELFVGGL
jgi:predicted ATP-dependent serine protease